MLRSVVGCFFSVEVEGKQGAGRTNSNKCRRQQHKQAKEKRGEESEKVFVDSLLLFSVDGVGTQNVRVTKVKL